MILTKVTIIDDRKAKDAAMAKRLKQLKGAYVTIGVHEDAGQYTEGSHPPSVVEVALWNEFGTSNIPERSFLRSAIDGNESLINSWLKEVCQKITFGEITVEKGLEIIGYRTQVLIQNKIKSNVPPPNAPSTVAQKQRDGVAPNTLINTGLLLRSITYKVFA